jgi:hypothetical protein
LAGQPLAAQNVATGLQPRGAARGFQTGTRGANFLRIGPSPRARALGDAGTALTVGATVLYYNPAAAALTEGFELAGTYTDLYGGSGIYHAFLGAILPVGDAGAVGAQVIVFGSGDIKATTEVSPRGGDPIMGDIVEWNSTAVGLTYAHRITDRLSVGGTVKFVQEGIDFAKVEFVGFDLGTMFDTGLFGMRIAASILNLGQESRFEGPAVQGEIQATDRVFDDMILGTDMNFRFVTDKMEMPTTFRFGLYLPLLGRPESVFQTAGTDHKLDLYTDGTDGFDTDIEGRIGLEYSYKGVLFLRGGKYFMNEDEAPWDWNDGLSGGLGFHLPVGEGRGIDVDYAYTNLGILDAVHTFGVQFGF